VTDGNGPNVANSGLGKVPVFTSSLPGMAGQPLATNSVTTVVSEVAESNPRGFDGPSLNGASTGMVAALDQVFGAGADLLANGADDPTWSCGW
jgi:hypothetical protein